MVIGRGDLATAITDREGFTFFCAGLSNREPISDRQKHNEMNRIWRMSGDTNMFVYFSSLSVYYADNEYTRHKLDMENLVKRTFDNHCIFRIGNIVWGSNPNTILNNFRHRIANNEPIEIQDAYRYLIDKDELKHWVGMIPSKGKHEMNCTGKRLKVERIVELIKEGKL